MKTLLRGALVLALVSMLMPASAQQLWHWSQTPASNSNADPAINWVTGMAPSAVSPSARAMMAAIAKYRDDTAGRLITAGTSTAYTVTTNTGYAAQPADGTRLSLIFHATNGANPILTVDGGNGIVIKSDTATPIAAGALIANSPYDLVYYAGGINAWLVVGVFGTPTAIPLGGIIDYAGTSAPNSNFALAAGQCISRTTYSALFSLFGTTFGACDGSTTFALPDLRGRVVAGLDNMGGSTAGRISIAGGNFDGTVFGNSGGLQNHTLTVAELPAHTPSGSVSSFTPSGSVSSFTPSGSVNITDPGHTHSPASGTQFISFAAAGGTISVSVGGSGNAGTAAIGSSTTGISASFSGNAVTPTFSGNSVTPTFSGNSIGSGNTHTILPPTMVLGKIIRII